ncbi:hypothetical protein GGI15_003433 [Coemansia interrupta]|uniref:Uncharacterized protein n=1 Tax=Coemansia interrupta TaxID=1126814 RepID=A0A9W8LHJ3_9FUNG|nr:hypothetical protein GGI15_003433 [Coemansia interrupta]
MHPTTESATVNCIAPGSTASEASWFIGSKGNGIDTSEPKPIKWVWGLPYSEAARAHDCVLQFPDDPMTRLLSEPHSSTWSVAMLLEMLAVSEECGSGRRTAYFTIALPVAGQDARSTAAGDAASTAEQGLLSFDEYDQILVVLFGHGMDFSSREGAVASSKLFLEFVQDTFSIKSTTAVSSGAPIVKDAGTHAKQQDTPKVNDLTMVIRKKRKVQD